MAVEAFLDHFLFANLGGPGVYHGQSRWKPEDFRSATRVFREDLTIRVAPDVPYHYGAYNWTSEGVPSRPTVYVDGGRLRTPSLNLKYAKRLAMEPTTPPRTGDSLRLDLSRARTWDECLAGAGEGVLITSVLGMHTQDPVRGDYSLAVPTAVRFEEGRLRGKCRAVLNDNFFGNLSAPDLAAVAFPHHDLPGLAFRSVVSPDKG
jgi:PmbA protein